MDLSRGQGQDLPSSSSGSAGGGGNNSGHGQPQLAAGLVLQQTLERVRRLEALEPQVSACMGNQPLVYGVIKANAALEEEMEERKKEIDELRRTSEAIMERNTSMDQKVEEVRVATLEAQEKNRTLEQELKELKEKMGELERATDAGKENTTKLEQKVEELQKEIEELRTTAAPKNNPTADAIMEIMDEGSDGGDQFVGEEAPGTRTADSADAATAPVSEDEDEDPVISIIKDEGPNGSPSRSSCRSRAPVAAVAGPSRGVQPVESRPEADAGHQEQPIYNCTRRSAAASATAGEDGYAPKIPTPSPHPRRQSQETSAVSSGTAADSKSTSGGAAVAEANPSTGPARPARRTASPPWRHRCLRCSTCGRRFLYVQVLKRHKQTAHPPPASTPIPCDQCGVTFRNRKGLSMHRRLVHPSLGPVAAHGGVVPCPQCAKPIRNNRLNAHILTHSEDRPFSCPNCGKKYKHSRSLKEHMLNRTGKPFGCGGGDKQNQPSSSTGRKASSPEGS